ncbi:iron-siderophore ABC transporter substrate-binding protein [Ensifer canadensis]
MVTETTNAFQLTRRKMVSLMALASFPKAVSAQAITRIAAIDWAMLETVVTLGVTPIAATELIQFRSDAVEPAIPDSVADLGLRGSPNFEYLFLLKPDLILISPFYARQRARLEDIAPVVSMPFYERGEPPYEKALLAVSALGKLLSREPEAARVLDWQARTLIDLRARLVAAARTPVYIINIGDARHFRAFGSDSMFGDILVRLGLTNAWQDQSKFTFAAPVPLEALASRPDARIVVVSEVPVQAGTTLRNSMIWRSLEPVRKGRLHFLDNVNPYGGISAGMRFARLLADALAPGPRTP